MTAVLQSEKLFGKSGNARVPEMKDYQASLERLRKEAAEAALIRDLAMDPDKRDFFDRLQQHLNRLADEVERAMPRTTKP